MSTKWNAEVLGSGGKPDFAALLKDEFTVILFRGKNAFGDLIYCYLKISFGDMAKLQVAIDAPGTFNISDFGSVIAAGKGEPSDEIQAEIAMAYPMLDKPKPVIDPNTPLPEAAAKPVEKKAWDEY